MARDCEDYAARCLPDLGDVIAAELPQLRRRARTLLVSKAEADDLVQDCIVAALRNRDLLKDRLRLRGWLRAFLAIAQPLDVDEEQHFLVLRTEPSQPAHQIFAETNKFTVHNPGTAPVPPRCLVCGRRKRSLGGEDRAGAQSVNWWLRLIDGNP